MVEEIKKQTQHQWNRGKRATISFYHRKSYWKFKQFNKSFKLFDYFGPMINGKSEVSIADLGAGVVSATGSTWPGTKVKLYPSDVLAEEFNAFLDQKHKRYGQHLVGGYKPLFPVEKQNMEKLTYANNSFDIVHCVNALDHCMDPFNAIKEMYRVCKPGGWIYLRHFSDNAKDQNYKGLHQWNISTEMNDCLFKSHFDEFLLNDCVRGFKTLIGKELDYVPDNMIISKLQKTIFS